MADPIVIDANILWSFAVVGRVNLLAERYGYRAIWTDAVEGEISRNVSVEPLLSEVYLPPWLPDPVSFDVSEYASIMRIRDILAAPGDHPAKHLGEAESIYYIEQYHDRSAVFLTDDGPAADLARRRRIPVISTADVMRECHSMAEIGCPDAWDLMREMERLDRHVHAPAHHSAIC